MPITARKDQRRKVASRLSEIRELHADFEASARRGLAHATRIGELLTEFKSDKAIGAYGNWEKWLAENVPGIKKRTAENYMAIYRKREDIKSASVTDLTEAYRLIRKSTKQEKKAGNLGGPMDGDSPLIEWPLLCPSEEGRESLVSSVGKLCNRWKEVDEFTTLKRAVEFSLSSEQQKK